MRHAARYVDKVWETARNLGFGKYFINANGGGVTDDHEAVFLASTSSIMIRSRKKDSVHTGTRKTTT